MVGCAPRARPARLPILAAVASSGRDPAALLCRSRHSADFRLDGRRSLSSGDCFAHVRTRAPRYFGRLCDAGGVHSEGDDASMVNSHLTELVLVPFGRVNPPEPMDPHPSYEGGFPDWPEYLTQAIGTLRLADAGVKGHEQCFHRRGRDLTPLMFRIALLLRTGEDVEVSKRDFLGHVPTGLDGHVFGSGVDASNEATVILGTHGEGRFPGAPRAMHVTRNGISTVIRNDGWIGRAGGVVDAAALWRQGRGLRDIATYVRELAP